MPDYESMSKNLSKAIESFGELRANEIKLKTSLMANEFEKKQNMVYKMMEQRQKQQLKIQNIKNVLDEFKKRQELGGDNLNIEAPRMELGAGGEPTLKTPSATDKQFKIKEIWGQIETKQNNKVPLNDIEKGFMEKYPKEIWIRQSGVGGVSVAQQKFNLMQEEKKQQQETKSQFVKDSALDTLNTIAEVEKGIDNFGLFGRVPSIPGTERANWEANVNKLLSGKVIDVMTKMKEASKTGATGFGQLSEKELKVLQEASTALKRGLSKKDALKYLTEMKVKLQKIAQSDETDTSRQAQPQNQGGYSQEDLDFTAQKYGLSVEEVKKKLGVQ